MSHQFRISGLRHMFFDSLKTKLGVRNYRIVCSTAVIALLTGITIPVALAINKQESFADGAALSNVVDVRFLNTQTGSGLSETYSGGASNLIKTKDGKYVLIDTGNKDSGSVKRIKAALKKWQGSDSLVIDYLVISHLDGDHYGNASTLISDSKVKVNNVVIKYEAPSCLKLPRKRLPTMI